MAKVSVAVRQDSEAYVQRICKCIVYWPFCTCTKVVFFLMSTVPFIGSRGMVNGEFLKELRNMKQNAPNDFSTSIKEIFHFNSELDSLKFRVELDKLQ